MVRLSQLPTTVQTISADISDLSVVWSKLQSLCLPPNGYINVPPLENSSFSYNLPLVTNQVCACNSVSYSLMVNPSLTFVSLY